MTFCPQRFHVSQYLHIVTRTHMKNIAKPHYSLVCGFSFLLLLLSTAKEGLVVKVPGKRRVCTNFYKPWIPVYTQRLIGYSTPDAGNEDNVGYSTPDITRVEVNGQLYALPDKKKYSEGKKSQYLKSNKLFSLEMQGELLIHCSYMLEETKLTLFILDSSISSKLFSLEV
jgi:hypothetical protein